MMNYNLHFGKQKPYLFNVIYRCAKALPPTGYVIKVSCILLFIMFIRVECYGQNYGLLKSQDPKTLPKSLAANQVARRKNKTVPHTVLNKIAENEFAIQSGWELIEASKVSVVPQIISSSSFNSSAWYNATVPGTVLSTLVDQGVYPDPYWGLNNLSIPDTLCRQKWWYRTQFKIGKSQLSKTCRLTFNGINYEAQVWLNGHKLGDIKGAFKRGIFDISQYIRSSGINVLAVQIIPPPHPGIPHEESMLTGIGPNGGALAQDGPTFISSEGWDWLPGIRDRNIGIWQNATLHFSDDITIGDSQVITDLDLPDTSHAAITIKTSVSNLGRLKKQVKVNVAIEGIQVNQKLTILPGETKAVVFSPSVYAALKISHPRLWWPNGYGRPDLYHLMLTASDGLSTSDSKSVRFGIHKLTYEMSVDAPGKPNWYVEFDPTDVYKKTKQPLFDNLQRRKVEGKTFVPALRAGAAISLLREVADTTVSPYLVIKVNGQRIFCKGGNWGMDDGMKRISRAQLEPYFKLSRQANFNMVRNWTGESTEETFYDLCDEYGLLVWNDFWTSTENYNVMPLDNALFLENAKEVFRRFRNHPSIAVWCPRNEGYLPPELEVPLANMVVAEDGTRHYQPNSRYLNLRTSGPWNYQPDPKVYFTKLADGFSTELGTTSVPTAATIRKMMAKEDLWPIGDVWYYHDFHAGQRQYVAAIDSLYGPATGLDDFCKKAQMVNYDSHRAMFEAFNSKLWNSASGILIWMSQPAWSSTVWQAYSYDYETFGSYFGVRNACEPVHIQMNLDNNQVIAINTSLHKIAGSLIKSSVYDLRGKVLYTQTSQKDVLENRITSVFTQVLPANLPEVYLVRLMMTDGKGRTLSQNDYWKSTTGNFKSFNDLRDGKLDCTVLKQSAGYLQIKITNTTAETCVGIKLNLRNRTSKQLILPAYCSDGYFNLLPHESKQLIFTYAPQAVVPGILVNAYNLKGNELVLK